MIPKGPRLTAEEEDRRIEMGDMLLTDGYTLVTTIPYAADGPGEVIVLSNNADWFLVCIRMGDADTHAQLVDAHPYAARPLAYAYRKALLSAVAIACSR